MIASLKRNYNCHYYIPIMFSQILKLRIVYLLMSFSILQEIVLCIKDAFTNILTAQIGMLKCCYLHSDFK